MLPTASSDATRQSMSPLPEKTIRETSGRAADHDREPVRGVRHHGPDADHDHDRQADRRSTRRRGVEERRDDAGENQNQGIGQRLRPREDMAIINTRVRPKWGDASGPGLVWVDCEPVSGRLATLKLLAYPAFSRSAALALLAAKDRL